MLRCRRPPARELGIGPGLWTDESGQDTTEYVLLVALIALAVTAGMTVLAQNINTAFSETGSILDGYVSS
jgi:Flp pilus assembly pilin Flp